ncbi:3-carboxy-cis,cis-muconate cycloisomerase [Streptomyces sp. NPDC127098]|uniref:3-carboxy-cis,cis-muconate cycloisomerase n=1 Tax=Streptomyces sp. NPDC127098 TaxID=3347137 RepID=UPI00364F6C2B
MSSADPPPEGRQEAEATGEFGLLSPGRAGSAVEAATGDRAFLTAMLDAEAALARAQAALGLVPAEAADAIGAVASADLFDVRALARDARAGGNPVIPLVAALTERAGTDAVHRGATSQDILDTAAMLVAARARRLILADVDRAIAALGALAAAHRDTPMAARTLTQHAVPTTFGLKAAGWRAQLTAAGDRLAALRLPAQLGGAGGTLAAFEKLSPQAGAGLALLAGYARELGLAEPALPWHASRVPVAELGSTLALVTGALGRIAVDVLVLCRTEIGELAEGGGGPSSAMPHKSNPVRATLVAAAARQAPALAAVLLGALAAEDERPAGAWHAEWQPLRELLRLTGGAARDTAELVERLIVRPDRMRENLHRTGGLLASERLAGALTPELGRDAARALLRDAAQLATRDGVPLADAVHATAPLPPSLSVERLRELTEPTHYTGAAGPLTDRALSDHPRRHEEDPRAAPPT